MNLPSLGIMPEARDYVDEDPLARNLSDVHWSPSGQEGRVTNKQVGLISAIASNRKATRSRGGIQTLCYAAPPGRKTRKKP